jgi:hypothetical protein
MFSTRGSFLLMLAGMVGGGCVDTAHDRLDEQTPPTNGPELETWLASGAYTAWGPASNLDKGGPLPGPLPPPPGGCVYCFSSIYANTAVQESAAGGESWPRGAAMVRVMFASSTDLTPMGYAVSLKLADDTAGGANWYWYERFTRDGHTEVAADGDGATGSAATSCVGCHGDAQNGARDLIFTMGHARAQGSQAAAEAHAGSSYHQR